MLIWLRHFVRHAPQIDSYWIYCMILIKKLIHPDVININGTVFNRQAARGIVLTDDKILLLFTERYNDFSFPGGGVENGEDIKLCLSRELAEETGARNIQIKHHYGYIEEIRPYPKEGFDLMHMISHFYMCEIDSILDEPKMESYELKNGMRPIWVNLHDAIKHNKSVLQKKDESMGQSIFRETFMLEKIAYDIS